MPSPAPFGLLLDVDGPLADAGSRTIRLPEIPRALAALSRTGIPIIFNTGRSDSYIATKILPLLDEQGISPDAPIWGVGEKGATWFGLAGGASVAPGSVHFDETMRVPGEFRDAVHAMVAEEYPDLMFTDPTKLTMVSTEQRVDVSSDDYLAVQPEFIARLDGMIQAAGLTGFQTGPSPISVDVESVHVGKDIGAERGIAMVAEAGPVPHRWITAGDSRSDYAMADWMHANGYEVEHVDVQPHQGVPEGKPYAIRHDHGAIDDHATLLFLPEWLKEAGA